jgi:hypothetical protein
MFHILRVHSALGHGPVVPRGRRAQTGSALRPPARSPHREDVVDHSVVTPRREVFSWATVLSTFALGTVAGDMTALTFHLGYFSSGLLFAG